jgi:hypothetical protein
MFHIEGRRWFRRTYGNTYTSAYIYQDGQCIAKLGPTGGYGDHFITMAIDWLKANGLVPADAGWGTRYLREELGASYSVTDVTRERDL